jgi:hypothetical protein
MPETATVERRPGAVAALSANLSATKRGFLDDLMRMRQMLGRLR